MLAVPANLLIIRLRRRRVCVAPTYRPSPWRWRGPPLSTTVPRCRPHCRSRTWMVGCSFSEPRATFPGARAADRQFSTWNALLTHRKKSNLSTSSQPKALYLATRYLRVAQRSLAAAKGPAPGPAEGRFFNLVRSCCRRSARIQRILPGSRARHVAATGLTCSSPRRVGDSDMHLSTNELVALAAVTLIGLAFVSAVFPS